jgi:8-oxo-dGTP pyrophosphatase MutT (NUDIX family)
MQFNHFVEYIKTELAKELPGINAQFIMAPNDRKPDPNYLTQLKQYKNSAVMLLVYPEGDHIKMVLTVRQSTLGNHAGQISLPGGKVDDTDISLAQTAIRETYEEIGVKLGSHQLLGKLTPLHIPVTNYLVNPFVAFAENKPNFIINEQEVASIIDLDIELINNSLIKKRKKISIAAGYEIDAPYYTVGSHVIWGATAMILSEFSLLIDKWEQGNI